MGSEQCSASAVAEEKSPCCFHCSTLSNSNHPFCMGCGFKNPQYRPKRGDEEGLEDCGNGHKLLIKALETETQLYGRYPFCEQCGECILPIVWRVMRCAADEGRYACQLMIGNAVEAYFYFETGFSGAIDPELTTINHEKDEGGSIISFDDLYLFVEKVPNFPPAEKEVVLALKDRWEVSGGRLSRHVGLRR